MKGVNSLLLNTETMVEIVQFWLNVKMINPPTVQHISVEDNVFLVEVYTAPEKKGKAK